VGRQDTEVGYKDQFKLLEDYPRASYVVLDKAGHNLQIEQYELFSYLVGEWIERVIN
jgi:pimeloyl-ACP methyl ester carboxylesterase